MLFSLKKIHFPCYPEGCEAIGIAGLDFDDIQMSAHAQVLQATNARRVVRRGRGVTALS